MIASKMPNSNMIMDRRLIICFNALWQIAQFLNRPPYPPLTPWWPLPKKRQLASPISPFWFASGGIRIRLGFLIPSVVPPLISQGFALPASPEGKPRFARFQNVTVTFVPFPSSLSKAAWAPWSWAMCLTMARPNPVPPVSRERLLSTR